MPMPLSLDRQRAWRSCRRVSDDAEAASVALEQLRLGNRQHSAAVAGIGGVGDQLAQEDVAVRNRPNAP